MIVRPAGQDDAPGIATVHVRSWQAAYRGLLPQDFLDGMVVSTERVERWHEILADVTAPRSAAFVADEGGVVGFAHLLPTRDEDADRALVGELTSIYALPERYGQGVGRALMATVLDTFATAGYAEATLWVLAGNSRASRFYEAAGWRYDGTSKTDELAGVTVTEQRYRRALR